MESPRLVVGITGATGTVLGVRVLQMLHGSGVETHLVVSKWGARTLDDMINHITMRVIDQFDIYLDVMNRWDGVLRLSGKE